MAATIVGAFQPEMQNLIKESKILLVGAGGIGCEVLKNLVLTGFSELEVIDLDTIEVSNLNRQFLFDKQSVGKAKSHVAKESVLKFNPNVNIKSHLGDIMNIKYGSAFFNQFNLVINALDNKKARSHVNRMCLACNIPLIESGTMGYSGQVDFIKKGLSLCYDCLPKPEPKSYPMCTIRNTPKEPIHCIIWAKFLFTQLFGDKSYETDEVAMDVKLEDSTTTLTVRQWAINNDLNPIKLLKKIFIDDINYLLSMSHLYEDKIIKPTPLDESIIYQNRAEYSHEPDNKLLTLSQYITMFSDCINPIKNKLYKTANKCLIWDKDDDDFMNFVVSGSNIRSAIFNIPFKSHFDIKSMAGNIIPAIATANAIIAGQIVIHALRALRGNYERCQSVFLRELPNHKGGVLVKDKKLQIPNPKCLVCATEGEIVLSTDVNKFTLTQLDDLVLKKKLNMVLPDVIMGNNVIISSDEDDAMDVNSSPLIDVGITTGSRLLADDYFQNYSIKIMVQHEERIGEEYPEFEIFNSMEELLLARQKKKDKEIDEPEEKDCILVKHVEDKKENISVIGDNGVASNIAEKVTNNVAEDTDSCVVIVDPTSKTINNTEEMIITNEHEIIDEDKSTVTNDKEISNEEILALKRKAEFDEDNSDPKKSRVD